jgi:hypothetical protein
LRCSQTIEFGGAQTTRYGSGKLDSGRNSRGAGLGAARRAD